MCFSTFFDELWTRDQLENEDEEGFIEGTVTGLIDELNKIPKN